VDNHTPGIQGLVEVARPCSYPDFAAIGLYVLALRFLGSNGIVLRHQFAVPKILDRYRDQLNRLKFLELHIDAPNWAHALAHTMLLDRWVLAGIAVMLLAAVLSARKAAESFGPFTLVAASVVLLIPFWLVGAWYEPGMIFLPILVLMALGFAGPMAMCEVWLGAIRRLFVAAYVTATFRCHHTEGTYRRFMRRGWTAAAGEDLWKWKALGWTTLVPLGVAILWQIGSGGLHYQPLHWLW
jgi:hypothetical protein